MKIKIFLSLLICLIITGCNTSKKVITSKAESEKDSLAGKSEQSIDTIINFELVSKKPNAAYFKPDINKREFVILDNYGNEIAMEKKDSVSHITFKDGHTIITEPKPYTLISADKKTIIKYGDETCVEYCLNDLLFYNDQSELLKQYDKLDPFLGRKISDNGYLVTSQYFHEGPHTKITLYSPKGDILFKKEIKEYRIASVYISNDGNNVIYSTGKELMIIDNTGDEQKLNYAIRYNMIMVDDYLYFSTNESDYLLNIKNKDKIYKLDRTPDLSIYNPFLFFKEKNIVVIASRRDISNFDNKCNYFLSIYDLDKEKCIKYYELSDFQISRIQGLIKQTNNSFMFVLDDTVFEFNIIY